jgi:hypothetical protein
LPAVRGCTGLQASDGNNLVSGPHPKREGTGAAAEDSEGAVVEWLERRDGAIAANSDEAGGGARLVARWAGGDWSCNCAWAEKKLEHLKYFENS